MKRIVIISMIGLLALAGCAAPRHKLSPQGNVNYKTANVYYNQQNVEEAYKYYSLVLNDNADHAGALQRLADINLFNGERFADRSVEYNQAAYEGYDKAIKIMEQYSEPDKKEAAAIRDMKNRRKSAWTRIYKAADTQYAAGNTVDAVRIYELSSTLDPSKIEPLLQLQSIYQKDLKDDAKAEEILLRIYAQDPNNTQIQQNMGIFYLNKQDYATALTFFEKVQTAEPLNVNNLLNITFCQFELEQFTEAQKTNQIALGIEPGNIDALNDAKSIAYKLNDKEGALSYLKKLLEVREDDKEYQEISFLLNELKQYDAMISYAKKWHQFDETNKDPVQLVILGAKMTNNKSLQTEYENILKGMN